MKILITDEVPKQAIELLNDEKYQVDYKPGMKEDELISTIDGYDALIVRSGTKVTKNIIMAAKSLKIIGRAGVGVDNINVDEATRNGICVMNTPFGNINSAAEHTIAMILALIRNIPQAHYSLKYKKEWNRSKFVGIELKDKTLGIIGIGKVGSILIDVAKSFHMKMLAFDKYVSKSPDGVKMVELDELLRSSDIISVHVPLTDETKGMISEKEFSSMKTGVFIANVARGGVINEDALYNSLKSGKVAGAAIDVWENEPATSNKLLDLDNVVATPHLGASTIEAQENVSVDVAKQIINAFKNNIIENSVNRVTKLKEYKGFLMKDF